MKTSLAVSVTPSVDEVRKRIYVEVARTAFYCGGVLRLLSRAKCVTRIKGYS